MNKELGNIRDALIRLSAAVDVAGHVGHHDNCEMCAANLNAISVLRWNLPHSEKEAKQ